MQFRKQEPDGYDSRHEHRENGHGSDIRARDTPAHMSPITEFLRLEDLIRDQGDVALVVEYENKFPNYSTIIAFSEISSSPSPTDISLCYFEACDTNQCTNTRMSKDRDWEHCVRSTCMISSNDAPLATFAAKKKYKPVA